MESSDESPHSKWVTCD